MNEVQARDVGYEAVRRFAYALRGAVVDKRLEQSLSLPLVFYYDADVVLRVINGFQGFQQMGPRNYWPLRNPRNIMVRALLACGYSGTMHLLRPHALELHEVLRSRQTLLKSQGGGTFRNEWLQFLDNQGIRELFLDLRDAIESAAEEAEKVDRFFELLAQADPTIFPAVELANGHWQQRLSRFARRGLINFGGGPLVMKDLLRDPVLWEMRELIGREREQRKGGRVLTLSVLRDATALCLLRRQIKQLDTGETVPAVRFYSETKVLSEAWKDRDSRLRELLTYTRPLSGDREFDFVVRDTDYFILRALFEELRFPDLENRAEIRASATLDSLDQLGKELFDLVQEGGAKLDKFLEARKVDRSDEVPLREYIDQFESLSFIRKFLLRYRPPAMLREAVTGLPEVWNFALRPAVHDRFASDTADILEQMNGTVQDLQGVFADLQQILSAAERWLRPRVASYHRPDPIKDLGLVRWGIELVGEGRERFNALIDQILSDDDEKWWRGSADLADTIRSANGDADQYAIGCSVLWALNMFDLIAQTLERDDLPVGLKLFCAAAKLRSSHAPSLEGKRSLLSDAENFVRSLDTDKQANYLVGLGYLFFHAWLAEEGADLTTVAGGEKEKLLDGWRWKALLLGREAVSSLPMAGLPWAFAVNHCVYVADAANLEGEDVEFYRQKLAEIETKHEELWNYRFADTMGYHYLKVAEERLKNPINLTEAEEKFIGDSVNRAERFYSTISADYGDAEIDMHKQQLMSIKERYYRTVIQRRQASGRIGLGAGDTI